MRSLLALSFFLLTTQVHANSKVTLLFDTPRWPADVSVVKDLLDLRQTAVWSQHPLMMILGNQISCYWQKTHWVDQGRLEVPEIAGCRVEIEIDSEGKGVIQNTPPAKHEEYKERFGGFEYYAAGATSDSRGTPAHWPYPDPQKRILSWSARLYLEIRDFGGGSPAAEVQRLFKLMKGVPEKRVRTEEEIDSLTHIKIEITRKGKNVSCKKVRSKVKDTATGKVLKTRRHRPSKRYSCSAKTSIDGYGAVTFSP